MCGIIGSNFLSLQELNQLNDLMNHRGPDQDGYFIDDQVALAHKRLSIVDLSELGRQPMHSEDGMYSLVFNGEIFNYKSLRAELQSLGHNFKSKTDTEVVLRSFIEWGDGCLTRFNGQFAFAIYSKSDNSLFLARDRMGIKPLYFLHLGSKFVFSSELKSILSLDVSKKVNADALFHYYILGFFPSSESVIEGVQKLRPGHYLVYGLESQKIEKYERYWDLKFENCYDDEQKIKTDVYSLLTDSVEMRMVADVPVGAFLSGGLDSSIVAYLMRQKTDNLKTFSVSFDHEDYSEEVWSSLVAKKLKTDHYNIEFGPSSVKGLIHELPYYFDEPLGDPSMIPMFLVAKNASQEVKVCLSGTGADELFLGYPRYRQIQLLSRLTSLPSILKTVASHGGFLGDRFGKFSELIKSHGDDTAGLYMKLFSHLFRSGIEEVEIDRLISQYKDIFQRNDLLNGVLNFDQEVYIPNNLLVKEDRASMAWSIEARVPFLDHRLVDYVNRISLDQKRPQEVKYLLKEIFGGKLPNEILSRKKHGFGVPLKHYFRSDLKDEVYDIIFNYNSGEWYDREVVLRSWERHQSGRSDYSRLFWVIISYNLWHQRWLR